MYTNSSGVQTKFCAKERYAVALKLFKSFKYNIADFKFIIGLKAKTNIYKWQKELPFNNPFMIYRYSNSQKTKVVPILGCSAEIPFKDNWYARCEYLFDFPFTMSTTYYKDTSSDLAQINGCKNVKHRVHCVKFGIVKKL